MDRTVNSYEDAHAKAYEILNLTQKLLDDNYALIQFIKWKWDKLPETHQLRFTIQYRGFNFFVVKNDRDMFDDEWYQSAAKAIAAWLLLQRGVSKTKSNKS